MNKSSIVHAVDRFLALPLCLLELLKIISILKYSKQEKHFLWAYSTAFCIAIYSFIQSQSAQTQKDLDGFIFWHCMWHMYPLLAIGIVSIERALSNAKDLKHDKEHPALSDLILRKMNHADKVKPN